MQPSGMNIYIYIYIYTRQPRVEYFLIYMGPSKMTYVYNGIRVKWSRIKWYTRSICTLLYMNFDGLYIIMNSPYRSLCTKFIIYAIILYGDQIVRRSFFMAPFLWPQLSAVKDDIYCGKHPRWKPNIRIADIRQISDGGCPLYNLHTADPFIRRIFRLSNIWFCGSDQLISVRPHTRHQLMLWHTKLHS